MAFTEKVSVYNRKWCSILLIGLLLVAKASGYSVDSKPNNSRRAFMATTAASVAAALVTGENDAAWASGGATAGKYTTIPIAKRRYYGRVQQAVHEFLLMGPAIVNKDLNAKDVKIFFDVQGVVLVPAKNQAINGQCTKKDSSCKGAEIRDSRYHDMKASMYLLGNAFRINQQKPPDKLPTVIAAKSFFREMDAMEKDILSGKADKEKTVISAVSHYIKALDVLDTYLDLVELPPTDSGHYDKEFDTLVGESARLT